MTPAPACTCTELERMTVYHDMRNEPHVVGCPRWGMRTAARPLHAVPSPLRRCIVHDTSYERRCAGCEADEIAAEEEETA